MKSRILIAFAALALGCTGVACAKSDSKKHEASAKKAHREEASKPSADFFDFPSLQRQLDNGLKVIVVKTPQRGTVSVQIPVQTGSRNEIEPGKTGFAHFFEHMMFRGTPKYSPDQYSAIVKAAGADQNAYTDSDFTNYYMNITPQDLEKVLEIEADRFQNLKYTEAQFRTEALAVKGEYLKNYSNPLLKGFEQLQNLAFEKHTYKHTTMGFLADIENMPNQFAYSHEFFDRWYRPEYAAVIVVGDVELEPTFALVEKYWASWKKGDYAVDLPVEPDQTKPGYMHIKWDGSTLPWLIMGWKAPAFTTANNDSAALAVLGELQFGNSSRLYQQLVIKEQLVDQMFYSAPRDRDASLFLLAIRLTKPEHAGKAIAAVRGAVLEARAGNIREEQVAETQSRLKYASAAALNSPSTIGALLATFVHYERDLSTINDYYRRLTTITAKDVKNAAQEVFQDARRTVVSISQTDALPDADQFEPISEQMIAQSQRKTPPKKAVEKKNSPKSKAEESATEWGAEIARYTVKIVEKKNASPLVDVVLLLNAGSAKDPAGKKGLAALTAALIAQGGTQKRSYEEIQRAYYPLAAQLNFQVDKEMIKFSGTVHKDNLGKWWEIASEQLFSPSFDRQDFDRLKQQQINAIRTTLRGNNDEELGKEALYESIYGPEHPYGVLNLGHAKDLEGISVENVKEFLRQNYLRKSLTFAISGDYDKDQFESMLNELTRMPQDIPNSASERPAPVPAAAKQSQRKATIVQKEAPAVAVSFGIPLNVKRGDPDWLALWLVRSWLGEHRNSSGQLYNMIREARGMNYGDYAYIEYFPNGMYLMQPEPNYARQHDIFQVWLRPLRSNDDALFATRAALYELDRLVKNGLTAEQFEQTRAFLKKNAFILTASQTRQLGYDLDDRYYGTKPFTEYVNSGLDALTLEQTNQAIKKHLQLRGAHFTFVTKQAEDLKKKIAQNAPSKITYNSEKSAQIMAEDKIIEKYPLAIPARNVLVLPEASVFE